MKFRLTQKLWLQRVLKTDQRRKSRIPVFDLLLFHFFFEHKRDRNIASSMQSFVFNMYKINALLRFAS